MTGLRRKTTTNDELDAKDLLVADIEHFGESLWRNEETGEKRLSFFLTLVTAVVGGLVALATSERAPEEEGLRKIAGGAAAALLVIGLLSYLRMIRRNLVTDGYLKTLKRIRESYKEMCPALDRYQVPLTIASPAQNWPRGGYAETVAVLNGFLVAALSWLFLRTPLSWAACAGVLSAAALWAGAAHARTRPQGRPACYFRAGVGAVVVNEQGLVLALERADVEGAWQLPQGGLEDSEDPEAAVFREVEEETGIWRDDLTPLGRYPELLAYELPPKLQKPKTGMGQIHYWFFFRYEGPPDLELPPDGESRQASWRLFEQITAEAADFRKPVYRRLSAFLTELLHRSQPT